MAKDDNLEPLAKLLKERLANKTDEELTELCDKYDFEDEDECEDEKGTNGNWDLAGEIAVRVGLQMREDGMLKDENGPVYGEECGQEIIYNYLNEIKAKNDLADEVVFRAMFIKTMYFLNEKEICEHIRIDAMDWDKTFGEFKEYLDKQKSEIADEKLH